MLPAASDVITLEVFGDESADGTGKRVFAIGALIGTSKEWELAVADWLGTTRGEEFHANSFETKFPDTHADLVQVIVRSHLAGFSIAMDIEAYREELAFIHRDNAYFKCLTDLLEIFADLTRRWNETNPGEAVQPRLVFDRRQGQGTIEALYKAFRNQPEWRHSPVLAEQVSFDNRANPRIQMADLFAREAMKDMERVIAGEENSRASKAALTADPRRFRFIQYPREYWRGWAAKVEKLSQQEGFSAKSYREWLERTGRVQNGIPADNPTNRFTYFAWADRQRASAKARP